MTTVCSDASQDTSRVRHDHAQGWALKRRTRLTPAADRVRRPDHWIYLDRWWATRLGVTRTAGMYRIRRKHWPWMPPERCSPGTGVAAATAKRGQRLKPPSREIKAGLAFVYPTGR
jgi:hypothetical protein